MVEVNHLGSVHVALALLPDLRVADGDASLLLVASVAGLRGFPQLAGDSASKSARKGKRSAAAKKCREPIESALYPAGGGSVPWRYRDKITSSSGSMPSVRSK
jgi:hypothetical protein